MLYGSSHAVLRGSSHAVLWGSSHAVLRESSHAELYGSSHAELYGSSHAVLWELSHAELYGSSHAELRELSHAELYGSSHAVLRESSHAELWESSRGECKSNYVCIDRLGHNAILIYHDKKPTIKEKDATAQVICQPLFKHNKKSFMGIYQKSLDKDGYIILYKVVNPKYNTDFYSGKIKYEGVVNCPDWNPNKNIQCGHGLHLSPTPALALSYHQGIVKKCRVKVKDFVVYPDDITKVRCKRVEVLGAVEI